MAPAGSFESLMAAIQGGADSVYFGAGRLNMRSRSSVNFSPEDLKTIASICRDKGLNSYLTLNIALFDNELDEMRHMVDVAVESNISAIIASDIAAIEYARRQGWRYISQLSAIFQILRRSSFTAILPMLWFWPVNLTWTRLRPFMRQSLRMM